MENVPNPHTPTAAERVAAIVAGRLDDAHFLIGVFCAYAGLLDAPGEHDDAVAALRELARLVQGGDR